MTGDLFDGEESANSTGSAEVVPNEQPPLGRGDMIGLTAWLKDLTYDEVHAFTAGFGPVLFGLLLIATDPTLAGQVLVGGFGLTMAALGERKVRNRALRYVVREPHYLLGGQALAGIVGVLLLGTLRFLGFGVGGMTDVLRVIA